MSTSLVFQGVTLAPVTRNGQLWVSSVKLAQALGYKQDDKAGRIYRRHAAEFTENMTQVFEIFENAQFGRQGNAQFERQGNLCYGRHRFFSLRGCHLIAMFARTPVAKEFRKWVLDVLERLGQVNEPKKFVLPPHTAAYVERIRELNRADAMLDAFASEASRVFGEVDSIFLRNTRKAYDELLASIPGTELAGTGSLRAALELHPCEGAADVLCAARKAQAALKAARNTLQILCSQPVVARCE